MSQMPILVNVSIFHISYLLKYYYIFHLLLTFNLKDEACPHRTTVCLEPLPLSSSLPALGETGSTAAAAGAEEEEEEEEKK